MVSFVNYVKYLDVIINGDEKSKIKYAFRILNYDNDGFITKEEIKRMIIAISVL